MVEIPIEHTSHYAWRTYKDEVIKLILSKDQPDIIEIGARRSPLFAEAELPENVSSYTIGDLSQRELDLAPGDWRNACFDVCGDVERLRSGYDVVFRGIDGEVKSAGEVRLDGEEYGKMAFRARPTHQNQAIGRLRRENFSIDSENLVLSDWI